MAGWAWRGDERRLHLLMAVLTMSAVVAGGLLVIWARSTVVGAEPIDRPLSTRFDARILEREEQPAERRTRLVLAMRDPEAGRAIKVRVNIPQLADSPAFIEGAVIRLQARLMPPASPMLPGGYDFARAAWFQGYAATGSATGTVELVEPARVNERIAPWQRKLAAHIRAQLEGSPGEIAAALASGDRGGIAEIDEQAMRDSGLTHLLSISGLHVSAVVGAVYFLLLRALAGWQWLALRVRLPLLAAGGGALAGIAYTIFTGSEVPTVRSCVGAVLVLLALALGREPLSLRMVAVAMFFVLLIWPESLVGPSFQMSFAAVTAIVVLHTAAPVRSFLAPRDQGWVMWSVRHGVMLLVTGLVIELALTPIVLFHFHRAGAYGAFANMIGIPLTTFATMPLIALALSADIVGLGDPVWWLVGKSLELLLAIAHTTAAQPGAVTHVAALGYTAFALLVAGGLWLALWSGRVRLFAVIPIALGTFWAWATPAPDILVSGDGRHIAVIGQGDRLAVLRESRSDYTRDNLMELSGMTGEPLAFADWRGARCSRDFCTATVSRGGRRYHLLAALGKARIDEQVLATACAKADIVVAPRRLPRSCVPRWIKADRGMLSKNGGMAISLADRSVTTVAQTQGHHGWWRGE